MRSKKKPTRAPDPPADELVLAEAIAAASHAGLVSCIGLITCDHNNKPTAVCVLGALAIADGWQPECSPWHEDVYRRAEKHLLPGMKRDAVFSGNDTPAYDGWDYNQDHGDSLGWAYREALRPPE